MNSYLNWLQGFGTCQCQVCAQNAANAQMSQAQLAAAQNTALHGSPGAVVWLKPSRTPYSVWKPRARQVAGKLWQITAERPARKPIRVTAISLEQCYHAYKQWSDL